MAQRISPIFIFSLPRSGSTLAQRILASHSRIASVAEPWVMLPVVYALRREGIVTEYSQGTAVRALQDFIQELPGKELDFYASVREMALNLYQRVATQKEHAVYFLDKTPRYHLIIQEILDIFPDAKCLLIWRNPLAVVASIVETWGKAGRWNAYRFNVDLYKGMENLVDFAQQYPTRVFQIRYEDMVSRPSEIWPDVFSYLELDYDEKTLEHFKEVHWSGSMGDRRGSDKFSHISSDPIDRWKNVLDSPLRKWWARRYLDWIGVDRLNLMGYDYHELVGVVSSSSRISLSRISSDAAFMSLGAVHAPLGLSGVKRQLRRILSQRRSYALT